MSSDLQLDLSHVQYGMEKVILSDGAKHFYAEMTLSNNQVYGRLAEVYKSLHGGYFLDSYDLYYDPGDAPDNLFLCGITVIARGIIETRVYPGEEREYFYDEVETLALGVKWYRYAACNMIDDDGSYRVPTDDRHLLTDCSHINEHSHVFIAQRPAE